MSRKKRRICIENSPPDLFRREITTPGSSTTPRSGQESSSAVKPRSDATVFCERRVGWLGWGLGIPDLV